MAPSTVAGPKIRKKKFPTRSVFAAAVVVPVRRLNDSMTILSGLRWNKGLVRPAASAVQRPV
jgi:hypothetical protein